MMRGLVEDEPEYIPAINAPPSFDLARYLRLLNWELMEHSYYRRRYTYADPLLWALLYFSDALISAETGPDINLAQLHLDLCTAAQRWIRDDIGPAELREAWIAPRGSGKSVWVFRILAAWALAHGHRRFAFCVAYNEAQAKRHLRNLKKAFATNALLRADFPELCTPARAGGSNTANEYVASSGAVIMAYGITSTQLGAVVDSVRPDLLIADDLEPAEGAHSDLKKDNILSMLVNGVFGMNPSAIVQLAGTVTMYGSVTHDLVRTALGERFDWVDEQNIRTYYYEPILTGPDGVERSYWEAKYSLAYLNSIRGTRQYELNYLNLPRSTANGLFVPHDYVLRSAGHVLDQALWVDPGVTTKKTSDPTGLAVASLAGGQNVVIEYAQEMRLRPDERRDVVTRICRDNPSLSTVLVDVTNGGDTMAAEIRSALPPGVKLEPISLSGQGKEWRFKRHLDYIQWGWVGHAERFEELYRQMLGWPKISHDDVLDAVAGVTHHFLAHRQWPVPR